MKRNIYELYNDHSKEADEMIERWSNFGNYNCGIKRDNRKKLAIMINTLKGEEVVKDYLNRNGIEWFFTDKNRLMINDEYDPKCFPDLYNPSKKISCEIKEIRDVQWNNFGEQTFKMRCLRYDILEHIFHNADNCIAINSSHNKIAQLDLNSIKREGDGFFTIKAMKVIAIGE